MNRHMLLTMALTALLVSGCALAGVRGSGNVITETRQVSDFDRVSLSGSGHVAITQGAEEGVSVEADDNLVQYVRTKVSGRTLELGLRWPGTIVTPSQPIRYNVSVKDLVGLEVSGSGDIDAASIETDSLEVKVSGSGDIRTDSLTAEALNVDISGSGDVVMAGEAPEQDIKISGSGNFDAGDLRGERVKLTIDGSGDATVWATESLAGRLSGSGSVSYYGSPAMDVSTFGSGKINRLGEKGEITSEVWEK
jgi:hypothetical protein